MDKKQLTGIFAGIGYFLLYACLMMVLQMLYTFVIMGISYIGGTRKETDFMSFANNNLLTAALLTIVSVGVIFYLIFKRRGKGVEIEWKLLPFTSKALVISVIAAVAYSTIFSLLTNYISPEGTNPIFRSANYYSGIAPGLGGCLKAVFKVYQMDYPDYRFYDTLAAARRQFGHSLPNHQLHTVAAACGYDLQNHHHALADAEACAAIALYIL